MTELEASNRSDLLPFTQSLPMALMRARESTMRFFRPVLAAHELTEQQWRVLRALDASPEAPEVNELAQHTFLLGPSLTRILSNLSERGLIARAPASHDQRRAHISITEDGRSLVATIAPLSSRQYEAITERLGENRYRQLTKLLEEVADLRPDTEEARP